MSEVMVVPNTWQGLWKSYVGFGDHVRRYVVASAVRAVQDLVDRFIWEALGRKADSPDAD